MKKEQEEAIENLKGMLEYKRQVYNMDTMRNEIVPALYDIDRKAIETVLSMLKEKDAKIEQKNTELAEKNAEIEKLNRQIDLMAEEIKERKYVFTNKTKKEIKQYFERKSEEWKKI